MTLIAQNIDLKNDHCET